MDIIHIYEYLSLYDKLRISKIDKRYRKVYINDAIFDSIWRSEIIGGLDFIYFKQPSSYTNTKKHPKYAVRQSIVDGKAGILRWMLEKGNIMDTNIRTVVKKIYLKNGKDIIKINEDEIMSCLFDFEICYPSHEY